MLLKIVEKLLDWLKKRLGLKKWEIYRIYQFVNGPFIKVVKPIDIPIHRPMHRLTRADLDKHIKSFQQQPIEKEKIIFAIIPTFIFSMIIIRAIIVLIIDDDNVWCTWFGSVFHLIALKRRPPEISGMHIAFEDFFYCCFLFGSIKNHCFFRLMMSYCHQIFDPFMDNNENHCRLILRYYNQNRNHNNNKDGSFMEMDSDSLSILARLLRWIYTAQCLLEIGSPVFIFSLALITYSSIDPDRNNFHLFNYSYFCYISHMFSVVLILAYWNYYGLIYASNYYLYLNIVSFILEFKYRQNNKYLIKSIQCSSNLRKNLYDHRKKQANFFTEIHLMNEYFGIYLSYLFFIYTSLFCQNLYVVLKSPIFSSNWLFFSGLSSYSAFVVISLCFVVARLFQLIFNSHKHYQSLLVKNRFRMHFKDKLKIMNTVSIIQSKTIGFSFLDQTYIQYGTLVSIIYLTATLFCQILKVM
nr:uncharacterized protein LOC124495257 [Dermatophagoides farinae]